MVIERKLGKVLVAALAAQFLFAAPIKASTLNEIQEQEQSKQAEISAVEELIHDRLNSVNEKKAEIDDLNEQVSQVEDQKAKTLVEIEDKKAVIVARKAQLEERLVALQTSSSMNNRVLMLMEAESFSDFINLFLIISQLQGVDNDRIELAIKEEQELVALETRLYEEIAAIEETTSQLNAESEILAHELGSLQDILNDNQVELNRLAAERATEEERLVKVAQAEKEAAEKAEAEKVAAAEAKKAEKQAEETAKKEAAAVKKTTPAPTESVVTAPPAEEKNEVVEKPVVEDVSAPAVPTEPAQSGRQVSVNATAYSRNQPSLSNHTFLGIDLRDNPMVIAVDPSVIPLWSLVEVPGYGIYLAGDTGSAIVGNRIDIHMENLNSAWAFGRRQLTVTVLN